MGNTRRIRTVLYGDQRLSSAELEILHTPAMQRLYGLKQLGLTDRVFIDASHARIHHVVGVLEQVEKLVSAIVENLERYETEFDIGSSDKDHETFTAKELAHIVRERKPVVRLIGLLHDLTHAPFGHTVEDEIQLVDTKHDEPDRQADAFYRLICQLVAWTLVEAKGADTDGFPKELSPFLSQGTHSVLPDPVLLGDIAQGLLSSPDNFIGAYWRLSPSDFAQLLAQLNCAMTALLHLEALHRPKLADRHLPRKAGYQFQSAIHKALGGTDFEGLLKLFDFRPRRDAFMLDIVGNTVCADLLDYAKRDSHFSGLRLDYDADRIAENFTLVSLDEPSYERNNPDEEGRYEKREIPEGKTDPFAGHCLRTAISLVSHKYRTDIPSELMNLLNVRFYIYERVIYHPTKCAAGSMLGTALQLLGWRSSSTSSKQPTLPSHLRFVGDDVFLHDIRAALDFILDWTAKIPDNDRIDSERVRELGNLDRVHSGLVSGLLQLRIEQKAEKMRRDLIAARLLLDRLTARRYYRPVFRASPSSVNSTLHLGAEELADKFQNPNTRYEAERRIEDDARLPLGSVTIHCPAITTARKIANVLLTTQPFGTGDTFKLKHIRRIDTRTFGKHQEAVKAVERMYGSMWRLIVFIAPEHLGRYEEIEKVVGRVIATTLQRFPKSVNGEEANWPNDPHLVWELKKKLAFKSGTGLERFASATVQSGMTKTDKTDQIPRADQLLRLFKTYAKSIKQDSVDHFREAYSDRLSSLSPGDFENVMGTLQTAIVETTELEKRGGKHAHSGFKFDQLENRLNYQLRIHGVTPPPKRKRTKTNW